jgi:hypothetical protein
MKREGGGEASYCLNVVLDRGDRCGASTKRPLLRTLLPYITVLVCVSWIQETLAKRGSEEWSQLSILKRVS